jgi:AcrR family transcriptional regulator
MSTVPRRDPLTEILLRPTTEEAPVVSDGETAERAAPERQAANRDEPRARPGAAMARSRAAILDGARRSIAISGTRIAMSQLAAAGGIAKATLYNHFRTRDEVLAALLLDEIDTLIASLAHLELVPALTCAATALSEHPLLEALAADDVSTLAALARIDVRSPGWAHVAEATESLLNRAGRRGTPTVLRWLSSFVLAPADDEDIASDVQVLVAGLPPLRADAVVRRASTGARAVGQT